MKAIQYFSDEYLERCAEMTPNEIARFLDDFRQVHGGKVNRNEKSKLISIKIPQTLLDSFRTKAELHNQRYQTKIKELMTDWVLDRESDPKH